MLRIVPHTVPRVGRSYENFRMDSNSTSYLCVPTHTTSPRETATFILLCLSRTEPNMTTMYSVPPCKMKYLAALAASQQLAPRHSVKRVRHCCG